MKRKPPPQEPSQQEDLEKHRKARARVWRSRGFTPSAPGTLPTLKAGLTVYRRGFGARQGWHLGLLRQVLDLTPEQWQRLHRTRRLSLPPNTEPKRTALFLESLLGPDFYLPLEDVQQYAAENLAKYRQLNGDRATMAAIVASGELAPWVADSWFLAQLQAAFPPPGKGKKTTLSEQELLKARREVVARLKAVSRLVRKYKKWLPLFKGNAEAAFRQVETDFLENSRIRNPRQKTLILQGFRRRIARKG